MPLEGYYARGGLNPSARPLHVRIFSTLFSHSAPPLMDALLSGIRGNDEKHDRAIREEVHKLYELGFIDIIGKERHARYRIPPALARHLHQFIEAKPRKRE